MAVGVLAFGSVIDDPGAELAARTVRRIKDVTTPFAIEFARCSKTRDLAPTLVPVGEGGAAVHATVLVLDDGVDLTLARDYLYRRERWRIGEPIVAEGVDWIKVLDDVWGLSACVYTALEANLQPRTPERLAELAIASAAAASGEKRRDGISYLQEQKRRGLATPLMAGYEAEVLRQTGTGDLEAAWERACSGSIG